MGDGDRRLDPGGLGDLAGLGLALGNAALGGNAGGFAGLACFGIALGDAAFGFQACRLLRQARELLSLGRLGPGLGGLIGDVAFLRQLGVALLALDGQAPQRGLAVLGRDLDLVVPDDLVALALALLGDLGERGQAFGIEGVVRIEMLDVGLVEPCQRDRFQFEPVRLQVMRHRRLHRLHEFGALFLQIAQRHGRRDRAQAVDELRLDQRLEGVGVVGPVAQGLGGERNVLRIRLHPDVELGGDVGPHPVLGDQRLILGALDLEAQRAERNPGIGMEDRQDDGAAVEHDLLAAESGADIGLVARRPRVERRHDDADDDDRRDDHAGDDAQRNEVHGQPLLESTLPSSCGAGMAWNRPSEPSTITTTAPVSIRWPGAAFARRVWMLS